MENNMTRDDCLAVVTGSSSGLGAAIAKGLLQDGWTVVGLSRRPVALGSPHYRHISADLGNLERLREVGDREITPLLASRSWKRIGLVNNAAAVGRLRSVEDVEPSHLLQDFALNTVAPVFLMGLFVRLTPPETRLRIVNISSGAATQAVPGLVDYGSSKAALRHAGMILGAELTSDRRPGGPRKHVSILSYGPGVVDTPMQDTARSLGGPWNQIFVDFQNQGLLKPPEAPARDVVSFLDGDSTEPFAERGFGEVKPS